MKKRPIFLNIVFFCEIIIGARVLMFTIPVLINKYAEGKFYTASVADWSIWALTLIAIYYFMTGLSSVLGHKYWKLFHYVGLVFTGLLTAALLIKIREFYNQVSWLFYLPALFALCTTAAAVFIRGDAQEEAHIQSSTKGEQ